jgi:hypothetical protein
LIVSDAKFAPMTASLLARKGEAAPSMGVKRALDWTSEVATLRKPVWEFRTPSVIRPEIARVENNGAPPEIARLENNGAPPAAAASRRRRIVVSLNPCEFERLGIAAVKKGMTRHELVRETMNAYLDRLASELNHHCACLQGGACCAGSSGSG